MNGSLIEVDREEAVLWLFLIIATCLRLGGVVLSHLRINPYSQADAVSFAVRAQEIATGTNPIHVRPQSILLGAFYIPLPPTKDLFGGLIAPFWWLPGPSLMYARLMVVLLGVLAMYNVYVIARTLHSSRAGLLAVTPFIFLPSLILAHAALLRESIVLFSITTMVRIVVAPPERFSRSTLIATFVGILVIASLFRIDNLPVYIATVGFGITYYLAVARGYELAFWTGLPVLGVMTAIGLQSFVDRVIDYLARSRTGRSHGTTAYLSDVAPQSVAELVAFSWIGIAYFYLAPFPWMVESAEELALIFESIVNAVFFLTAIFGFRVQYRRNPVITSTILFSFLAFSILYGVVEGNVGAAVRHRQMFTWVIYVFGSIYLAERLHIVH